MNEILTIKTSNGKISFYLPEWLKVCTQSDLRKVIMLIRTAGWLDYTWRPEDAYKQMIEQIDKIILEDKARKRNKDKERHVKIKMLIRKAAGDV